MQQEEKKLNIQSITNIEKFINNYPDQQLHQHFNLLKQSFPNHRAVKGDGNCFYRAFAFLYLSNNQFTKYEQAFPLTQMNYHKKKSFIKSNYHFQNQLKSVWDRYLKHISKAQNRNQKQQKLQLLFNQIQLFDQLMIGYFRSRNYQHIKNNRDNLVPFLQQNHNIQTQLQRVSTFGAESEGIEIYSLADAMKTKITIFCIDYRGFQPIQYKENLQDKGFYLFYRPGHYDIVYPYNKKNEDQTKDNTSLDISQKTGFFQKIFRNQPQTKQLLIKTTPTQKVKQRVKEQTSIKETKKPQNIKKVMLGDFENGPMGKVWVQILGIGVLSLFAYVTMQHI